MNLKFPCPACGKTNEIQWCRDGGLDGQIYFCKCGYDTPMFWEAEDVAKYLTKIAQMGVQDLTIEAKNETT